MATAAEDAHTGSAHHWLDQGIARWPRPSEEILGGRIDMITHRPAPFMINSSAEPARRS